MQPNATTVTAHGLQWLVAEEFSGRLQMLDLEHLRHPERLSPEELVKDSTVRTVAHIQDPAAPDGPGLFIKRFKFRDLTKRLLQTVLPTKADVEWRMAKALEEAGVPTCHVLAMAVDRTAGVPREGWLVIRELPFVVELREAMNSRRPGRRHYLIEEMAALTARMVDSGLYHADYHAGNILIHNAGPRGERAFVIDLHSIRRVRVMTRRRVLNMVAMLDNSTRACDTTPEERLAFLHYFLEAWAGGPGVSEEALTHWGDLALAARKRLHRRHMASRTRRCMLRSSLFTPDSADGFRIRRRRDLPLEDVMAAVRQHRDTLAAADGEGDEVLRHGRRTQVSLADCAHVPPLDLHRPARAENCEPGEVCVKAFLRPNIWEKLRDLLRPPFWGRARASYIAHRGMRVRGISAPAPLALLENRFGPADYVLSEAIPHDGNLHDVSMQPGGMPRGRWRLRLGRALADLLRRMAQEHIYHPDTKPTNVLVRTDERSVRVWLVDLDRVSFRARIDHTWWVKNLARLNAGLPSDVSLLDRMRCLRECGRDRWTPAQRQKLARDVAALSMTRNPLWLREDEA